MADPSAAPRKQVLREVAGFAGVGGLAFAVQLGLFNVGVHAGLGPLSSNAVAVVVSVLVAYVGNRYLSFGHRRAADARRELGLFVVVNIAAFVIGELLLSSAYLVGGEHDAVLVNVLDVVGIGLGTLLRFWAYRRFVFVDPAGSLSADRHPDPSVHPTATDVVRT